MDQNIKYRAVVLVVLYSLIFLIAGVDLETILAKTPEQPVLAACVLLLLYAFKSATIFFPIILLEIAGGHLFPTASALLLNAAGLMIVVTVPYWIGRFAGMDAIERLVAKYPKFEAILERQQRSSFFLCFFLRVISCLPGDVVTMYLGATGTPFLQNLTAGVLGMMPGMILATLLGSTIRNPASPMFWITLGLHLGIAAVSLVLYTVYWKRIGAKQTEEEAN